MSRNVVDKYGTVHQASDAPLFASLRIGVVSTTACWLKVVTRWEALVKVTSRFWLVVAHGQPWPEKWLEPYIVRVTDQPVTCLECIDRGA